MSVEAKICGLTDEASVRAAVEGGAQYIGFVFYPRSPRAVTPARAAELAAMVPPHIVTVGLFVDATDAEIDAVLRVTPLRALQLHGKESPARVDELKRRTGLTIIKALGIADEADLEATADYTAADILLLDGRAAALPGGNGVRFDASLLRGRNIVKPWMLAGGLTPENLTEAVEQSGARIVDVSSGVEQAPGKKDLAKIRAFLDAARRIETSY